MSRIHRLRDSDRIFFVTVNLRRTLAPLRTREYGDLIASIDASRAKLGFKLLGYVVMPDHWHALVSTASPLTISRALQDVKWLAARAVNCARATSGAVWQHQFWDRFVRHRKEFEHRLTYMHFNPVKRGLVSAPEDWRWSSCNNFSADADIARNCPIAIDRVELPENYRA
ncbi:MAG TPA: transposase [Candidatus Acidoferrum sp.]|nr:transposase [Candidatus Acidoferrum sp.]